MADIENTQSCRTCKVFSVHASKMTCSLQVEVPEWYTAGFLPPDKQSSSFERDMAGLHLARSVSEQQETEHAPVLPTLEHWEVLAGGQSLSECRDTVRASLAL